jgi:hypothetical protein
MKFQFQISLNEDDYFQFNKFHLFQSPYGSKRSYRGVTLAGVIFLVIAFLLTLLKGFTTRAVVEAIPILLFSLLLFFYKPYLLFVLKAHIDRQKKKGKVAFSPKASMEFYEDHLVETTEENRTEQKYVSVERISVVKERYVYLHTNNIMAYIIPMAAFASKEEYDSFLAFAKESISEKIDFYEKI